MVLSRRFFLIALVALLLFITFTVFFDSIPTFQTRVGGSKSDFWYGKDESLQGAEHQAAALKSAPTYIVIEEKPPPNFQIEEAPTPAEPKKKKKEQETNIQKQVDEKKKSGENQNDHKEKFKPKHADERHARDKPRVRPGTFEVTSTFKHDPQGPQPDQIVLLSAGDGKGHNHGIPNIVESIKPNRQEYCDLHGYKHMFINITKYDIDGAHPVWAKLPAIVEAFNTYPDAEWVWWLDLDAIIMTPDIDLNDYLLKHAVMKERLLGGEELIKENRKSTGIFMDKKPNPANIDLIITQDHNGVNAGSFFLRRSSWTQMLIDVWSDPMFINTDWVSLEQDALAHLIYTHPIIRNNVGIIVQNLINAYPLTNVKEMGWVEGNLVVHVAGCWTQNKCEQQWKEYFAKAIPVSKGTTVSEILDPTYMN